MAGIPILAPTLQSIRCQNAHLYRTCFIPVTSSSLLFKYSSFKVGYANTHQPKIAITGEWNVIFSTVPAIQKNRSVNTILNFNCWYCFFLSIFLKSFSCSHWQPYQNSYCTVYNHVPENYFTTFFYNFR